MSQHRVLFYSLDGSTERIAQILERHDPEGLIELVGVAHKPMVPPTPEQLVGHEAVIGEFMPVRGQTVDDFAAAEVRLVASMSIGLNHMDVAGLARRGVMVSNCPGYCAQDVAQHALALMLDLMRKVTFSNRDVLAGGWNPKLGYPMHRAGGQTLGLVFFGRIAREVVPLARALGMRVVVWAPTKTADELAQAGCEKAGTLDDLLRQSDVVSLHCPLIDETRGLIGSRELSLMKPTALLVNTARGEVVDEDALVAALDEGISSGGKRGILAAGLDTLAHEATGPNPKLIAHPRCVVTPHSAYDSVESADDMFEMSVSSVCELLLEGRRPTLCVEP